MLYEKNDRRKMRRIPFLGLVCWMLLFIPALSFAEGTTAGMIQLWKDRANKGSALAPFSLGYCYQHGEGVEKNLVEAAKWYSIGAERGDFQAALELAGMYLEGQGVQRNEEKAIEWYVKIGKSDGEVASMARTKLLVLARNYSLGDQGVKPNKTKARSLFERLFEVEIALMKRCQAQINESVDKFNQAMDTIEKNVQQ